MSSLESRSRRVIGFRHSSDPLIGYEAVGIEIKLSDWLSSDALISYEVIVTEMETSDWHSSDALIRYEPIETEIKLSDWHSSDPFISYFGVRTKSQVLELRESFDDVVLHPIWSNQLSQESASSFMEPNTTVGQSN
eukprot:TRINITY_DN1532_c0_g1_i2.p2 TRINITY_DN1532_c0_g1~~TRINITY_DN1532_c0_g1_i2.p2  ORF type:complete len:136 (-),score=22.13 TRINITY_DN1532_c0_g1_i2:333-740(-)